SSNAKCQDMVKHKYYDHKNPNTGVSGIYYVDNNRVKYSYASENLNKGIFKNAKSVVDSWMSSESHKASIVDPKFTEIGFAVCKGTKPDEIMVVHHKIEK